MTMSDLPLNDLFYRQVENNMRSRDAESKRDDSEEYRIESEKRGMLGDPSKIEKAVANMADYLSPTASTKKPKGESYGIDSVEGSKNKSDPTVGYGYKLRDAFTNALMDPKYRGVPAGTLLQGTADQEMARPDNTGRSLKEQAYEFTRTEESRMFGGVDRKKIPGYDAWYQDKRVQEKQNRDKESWFPSVEEMATSGGVMGTFGLAAGLAGGGISGALAGAGVGAVTGAALGGPVGAAIGTVVGGFGGAFGGEATGALAGVVGGTTLGVGGEILAAPLKKLLHKTDWYEGMIQSNSAIDKGKAIIADMATFVPGASLTGMGIKSGQAAIEGAKAIPGGAGGELTGAERDLFGRVKGSLGERDQAFGQSSSTFPPADGSGGGGYVSELDRLIPKPEPSVSVDKLLPKGRSQAWGLQTEPLLPATETIPEGANIYRATIPKEEEINPSPLFKPSNEPVRSPNDRGQRYSLLEKALADNKAANDITQAVQDTAKAKNSIATAPQAENILKVVDEVKMSADPVPGSGIVEKHANLSPVADKEIGLDPITPEDLVADPSLKVLDGPLEAKIANAYDRDSFVKIGTEPQDGELRSKIAENASADAKKSLEPVSIDAPVVEALSKIPENPVVTPKQQEAAVKTVNDFTNPTKVEEEFFPSTGRAPKDIEKAFYKEYGYDSRDERLKELHEEAGGNPEKFTKLVEEENQLVHEYGKEVKAKGGGANGKLILGMAGMGVGGAALYSLFQPNTADASPLTEAIISGAKAFGTGVKEAAKAMSPEAIAKEALTKKLISIDVAKGQTTLFGENIQNGLVMDAKVVQNNVAANIRAGKGAGVQYSLMSPYQAIEALFTTGKNKMVNAATVLASFVTAGKRNADNAVRVALNIFDEAGIKTEANAIRERMAPVVPYGARSAKSDTTIALLRKAQDRLEWLKGKIDTVDPGASAADIEVQQKEIGRLKETLDGLGGATQEFHSKWEEAARELATKYSGFRTALALEDPTKELYPWLPKLSRAEEVATGKLRVLMDQYGVRLKERGIATRDNYLPHSPHPEMAAIYQAEMDDVLGGAPYQQFYSRTENSRPMLADINYTMNHYLNDIEPRLQNHDFWIRSGWEKVKDSAVIQANPGLKRAFDNLYEGSKPAEQTWGNIAAQKYSEFEAVRTLFLSPSAGLKHLIKATADIASVGPEVWAKSMPDTLSYLTKAALNKTYGVNQTSMRSVLEKLGVKSERFNKSLIDNFMDSTIMSGNIRKYMLDMGIDSQEEIFSTAKNLWRGVQDVGSTWINLAELADRATSVSSALQMASKKGMTVDQAMYGSYDLILKNNFLYGQFNPAWLNNPKIRAFLMFQATPAKIFERRLVNAQRSYANLGQLNDNIRAVIKEPGGWDKVLEASKDLFHNMREGQSELKSNLIIDTLNQETDFFGTPIVRQFLTDALTVGAATYGGAQAGMALSDHFFHIPFLSTQSDKGKMELATSPIIKGVTEGYSAWRDRESGEDFLLGSVMKKWMGNYGPLPQTIQKAIRLSNNDIPEIYQRGGDHAFLKYLFGIPGKE